MFLKKMDIENFTAVQVSLAKKVDKSLLGVGVKKMVADWQSKHGVCTDADSKTPLSLDEMTSLVCANNTASFPSVCPLL